MCYLFRLFRGHQCLYWRDRVQRANCPGPDWTLVGSTFGPSPSVWVSSSTKRAILQPWSHICFVTVGELPWLPFYVSKYPSYMYSITPKSQRRSFFWSTTFEIAYGLKVNVFFEKKLMNLRCVFFGIRALVRAEPLDEGPLAGDWDWFH